MRIRSIVWGYAFLSLAACGGASPGPEGNPGPGGTAATFSVPDVKPGYTRLVAPVIADIAPGGDAIQCQYVLSPFDRDMDVLDVTGYQSQGGHHSIAYAVKNGAPVGTSRTCNTEDNTSIGGFLGGVGGEAGGKAKLPDGVVFRLTKGSTIMLNTHFLNPSEEAIDGQTVLDVKFDEVDTSRRVASIFVNVITDFDVAPQTKTTADATCILPRDMELLSFTNHMHSYGARSNTALTPVAAGGAPADVHTDAVWNSDMQFNPVFTEWTLDAPLHLSQGDTLRTHCEWENTTNRAIAFPDEMCVGFGFFLTDGSSSPICWNGTWSE